jgi:hypothetical protein
MRSNGYDADRFGKSRPPVPKGKSGAMKRDSILLLFVLAALVLGGCGGGDTGRIDNSQYHPDPSQYSPGNGQVVPDEGPPPHNYQPGG